MHRLLLAAALILTASIPAFARSQQDRASVGDDITIAEGDTAADIACAFCSVHIHGDVKGDVAVLFGSVTLDSGHRIAGDVAALGGDLNMGEESEVAGDVAIAAGDANLASGATIHDTCGNFPACASCLKRSNSVPPAETLVAVRAPSKSGLPGAAFWYW